MRCFRSGHLLWVLVVSCAVSTADDANSPYLYCTTCHGADGNGNEIIGAPKISGMQEWYVRNQVQSFLAGWRGDHVDDDAGAEMQAIAGLLSREEELVQVISYISGMMPAPADSTVDGDVARGRVLYQTCAACHGPEAQGVRALNAPALAGQSDWYLVKSLNDFRQGVRGSHPDDIYGIQMKAAVTLLDDDAAVRDVVAYIQSYEPGRAE